jgi:uncharacterized membrane protein YkoI
MNRIALIAVGWLALIAAVPAPSAAAAQASQAQPSGDSLGADWGTQQDDARAGVRQGRYIPLSRAIEIVRRRSPGHQLDAGIEQWNGRAVYRIRWAAAKGRRVDYIVDAVSGAILRADGG